MPKVLKVALATAVLALFLTWTLAPVALMLRTSFTHSGIATGAVGTEASLANYSAVLVSPGSPFLQGLGLSLLIATCSSALTMLLAVPAAYALARFRLGPLEVIGAWILSTRFLPPVVAAIPLFIILSALRLTGNWLTLCLVDLLIGLAFAVWVSRSFLEDLPANLEALAIADGLKLRQRILRVAVPAILRPLGAVFALVWLFVWNDYLFALFFAGDIRPLTVVIASWNTYQGVQWGQACAAGTLAAVPPLVVVGAVSVHWLARGLAFGWRAGD